MRKDTQALLLLLLGATLVKISLTGTYLRYVGAGLRPLLLVAAAVLIAVAVVALWEMVRAGLLAAQPGRHVEGGRHAQGAAAAEGGQSDDAPPGLGEHRVGWLLLLPVLALLLIAPPALGSYQAGRNGTALATQAESDFAPLPGGDPVRLTLLDYAARAAVDQGRTLTGRRITLAGFVLAGPQGRPYLARLLVDCCAADARPVKIGLAGDVPADLNPDQWIEVVGTYAERFDRDPVNGELIPYIQVAELRYIAAPQHQYERRS